MKQYVALRRTRLRDGFKHLPRPKLTQEVLLIGSKTQCTEIIELAAVQSNNQSTDEVEVDLLVTVYDGHKTHNSKEIRKDNGKRLKK